jgi:glycerol 3-phosphatase-2
MRFAYVTNNASRRPAEVADLLTQLGIPAAADDVVTSGQAAARVLAERLAPGTSVLVVGTDALADEVCAVGLQPVRPTHGVTGRPPPAVVQGLSPRTTWQDLAAAAVAIHHGALWVAGNTDPTLPSPQGPLPGNGAFVEALRSATGADPVVAGKPHPALHRASVERVGARQPLVVGDRLDTDVLGAVVGGADSLLVLTGVTGPADLLQAPPGSRPTYLAADLRALLAAQTPVAVAADEARCGAAVASYDQGVLRLTCDGATGSGAVSPLGTEELRALAALAWHRADHGLPVGEWPTAARGA